MENGFTGTLWSLQALLTITNLQMCLLELIIGHKYNFARRCKNKTIDKHNVHDDVGNTAL